MTRSIVKSIYISILVALAGTMAISASAAEPRTHGTFISYPDRPKAPQGLDGRNIALWPSHGRYFDSTECRWQWQRPRLFGTVEDLLPQELTLTFLAPMLENAGAYVMMPRERDRSRVEVIADRDSRDGEGYVEHRGRKHRWTSPKGVKGFALPDHPLAYGENPFEQGDVRQIRTVTKPETASTATWNPEIPAQGEYAIYVSYASLPNSAEDARYTVRSLRGTEEVTVNQTMGGGTWVYLGTFPLAKGKSKEPIVELSNLSASDDRVVTADAVKIGGGMGNVARGGDGSDENPAAVSGDPRFMEGARYWLQWAGMPTAVYSASGDSQDYVDDYKARGLWVNHLAGGSERLPEVEGLGIPIDLALALHTDAGITDTVTSTIGTLPIICTDGEPLAGGESRATNRAYADSVTSQIVNDIRATFDPLWHRRALRDKPYAEAKTARVPALLMELLSHQNFSDMRLMLDPEFQFTLSRAIYKGVLKYLSARSGSTYVVAPLPVKDFAITGGKGEYTLTWAPTPDPLEPTASADYYIVYERTNSGTFSELAVIDEPRLTVTHHDRDIHSYRIVAANGGGVSFPSETLALCDGGSGRQVEIVNGFTRVSGPAEVYTADLAGFDYAADHGVPYGTTHLFTGEQIEMRRSAPFVSNDVPGHGASRAWHEGKPLAGNTFDFVYTHGEAIRTAGHPFISSSLGAYLATGTSAPIIDLILGKQRELASAPRFRAFPDSLRTRLADFCASGGSLFVSGSYIGSELFASPFANAGDAKTRADFARTTLGIAWRTGAATVTGTAHEVRSPYPSFRPLISLKFSQNPDSIEAAYPVEAPESFTIADRKQGAIVMRYTENGLPAATAFAPATHRAVTLGFPFESILTPASRSALMKQILSFLEK